MFRMTACPSSGETAVFLWHLVLVIVCGWLFGMQGGIHTHLKHVEIDKCTKNKLCTKLLLFTRLYKNVRSVKHEVYTFTLNFISCFQPNALVYYIFSYSSTCFEPYYAHHQEDLLYIYTASGSLCVTLILWPFSAQAVSSNCLCTERSHKKSDT